LARAQISVNEKSFKGWIGDDFYFLVGEAKALNEAIDKVGRISPGNADLECLMGSITHI
jgi:hypothetical protein